STFTALGGTEKCCQTPGRSVNLRSIIWTFSSLIVFRRSSAVAQFGIMASLLVMESLVLRSCCRPAASALVRPTHHLHGVFDVPPGFGQLDLAFCFEPDGVLGRFGDGLRAMCFQQLPRIVVDFDFSHGVMLLCFRGRPRPPGRAGTASGTVCILVR